MTDHERELARNVRERIHMWLSSPQVMQQRADPVQSQISRRMIMEVTVEELEACEEAILENLKERGLPPVIASDESGLTLFKGVCLQLKRDGTAPPK